MAKNLRKITDLLFVGIFYVILIQFTRKLSKDSFAAMLLLFPFLVLMLYVVPTRCKLEGLNYKRFWRILMGAGCVLLGIIYFTNDLKLYGDWSVVIQDATDYVLTGEHTHLTYFAIYPNNKFWLSVLIVLFKIVKLLYPLAELSTFKAVSRIFGFAMTLGALQLLYQTARLLMSEKRAFLTGCLAALYLPVYLYAQMAYTDVPGLFLMALLLYEYALLKKSDGQKTWFYLALLGGTAAIAYRVKVLVFIIIIAIVIEAVLDNDGWKHLLKKAAFFAAAFLVLLGVTNVVTEHFIPVSEQMQEQHEFPLTHWVMMGLKGQGGYADSDVKYTKSFSNYEEKQKATVSKIEKRLKKQWPKELIRRIFGPKVRYTWCNGMLAGDDYGMRRPWKKTLTWELCSKNGTYAAPLHLVENLHYYLILTGVLLSGIFALTRRKSRGHSSFSYVCRLGLLGFFMFQSIWECNSRYLLCFLPVLILVASDGLFQFGDWVRAIKKGVNCSSPE